MNRMAFRVAMLESFHYDWTAALLSVTVAVRDDESDLMDPSLQHRSIPIELDDDPCLADAVEELWQLVERAVGERSSS
jgi:hypothetical protein